MSLVATAFRASSSIRKGRDDMGGGSGGRISSVDISKLEATAKQKLSDAVSETSRHVFISFASEDMDQVNLLRGQAKNENVDLAFDDHSVKEAFDSENVDYIKRNIREKIDRCSVTLVYLSENAAQSIWVNWEIEESLKRGKGVIGVYDGDAAPTSVPTAFEKNGCRAIKWNHAEIMKAIEAVNAKRSGAK